MAEQHDNLNKEFNMKESENMGLIRRLSRRFSRAEWKLFKMEHLSQFATPEDFEFIYDQSGEVTGCDLSRVDPDSTFGKIIKSNILTRDNITEALQWRYLKKQFLFDINLPHDVFASYIARFPFVSWDEIQQLINEYGISPEVLEHGEVETPSDILEKALRRKKRGKLEKDLGRKR